MSQIVTKQLTDLLISTAKIAANAVTTAKVALNNIDDTLIRLTNNNSLRARNAANSGDVNILKVDASNIVQLQTQTQIATTPTAANDVANKSYVDGATGGTPAKENKTLSGTDITNQYVDLAHTIKANTLDFMFNGLIYNEGVDYSVNLTGGSGGVTRVTFLNDLATGGASALAASDVLYFKYQF